MVAVDVSTGQFWQLSPMIDNTARQRPRLAVVVVRNRRRQRLRAHFPIGVKNVAAFIDAPPKIRALGDEINLLPKVLAVIAHPDVAGLRINRQPPWITQAVSPRFRNNAFNSHEWIVSRHAVLLALSRMIDIDPQHLARELRQILAAQ